MRDTQRSRIERAEHRSAPQPSPLTPQEVVKFIDAAIRTRWFKKRWPLIAANLIVELSDSRRYKLERCRDLDFKKREGLCREIFYVLHIVLLRRSFLLILHDLAHLCSYNGTHDRAFVRTYLLLVNRFLGEGAARLLARELRSQRVRWRRSPRLSDGKREELRERFNRIRGSR